MLGIKRTTIKVEEKATDLIRHCKKLMGKLIGMSFGDCSGLEDEEALIINDSLKLMDETYEYAELQAKQLDQINERLDDILDMITEMKKQQS